MDEKTVRESQLTYRNTTRKIMARHREGGIPADYTNYAVINARNKLSRDLQGE